MAGWYNAGKAGLANGTVDWDTSDIRMLLVTSNYTFNADHNSVADITAIAGAEASGTGYARKATTRAVAENDANDRAELRLDPVTWTAANFGTVNGAVVYLYNADDAQAKLLSHHEFTSLATNGGDVTVSFGSNNATFLT